MAIQFARARYISRSSGGSAVRSAAYNGRDAIEAERTGEVFHFRHRDAPEHHAALLPDCAPERFAEPAVLWNAAEAAERRKDAQVAREIVLALPADREVSTEDRVALARSFATEYFVSKGLAVQLDVHAPHGAEAEGERANWHAHLLITTRRIEPGIEGGGFAAKKARDLDPEVRSAGGRARVADGAAWGELWREHQDRYFREHGIAARVDPTATHAQEHVGPVRMRRVGSDVVERAEAIRRSNEEAARDPAQVLAALTRNNATFTERELTRFLTKQLGADLEPEQEGQEGRNAKQDASKEIARVRAAVLASAELVALHDRETGAASGRFTTVEVREQERTAMATAGGLARQKSGAVSARSAKAAEAARTLRPDQAAAFDHATAAGHLKLVEGRAGTGKSYTLAAIRDAHARDGRRVVGLAPTNAVAQDLAHDGFAEARTVHAALFALKNGRTAWDKQTVVIVDEAAMLDTRVTGELLDVARHAGAKLILAGDDRQLASVERGGLFAELRQRHGAAEITEVTRQRVDWQRHAARDLAEGRFDAAVGAFDKAGAITWTERQDEARRALVDAWKRDAQDKPGQSRFVFAYTNRDVDTLNAELRQVRRDRGELAGADVALETKHGAAAFAVGDRVQFTDTDKRLGIHNGNVGTITRLDPSTGAVTARLDAAGREGRDGRAVTWDAGAFQGFRHGYAGTIYKGQGKTLDRTYLYHTEHWRAAASYVALTRQRESAAVFVARETAKDVGALARQMARGEVRAASIAWSTRDELTPEQKQEAERAAELAEQRGKLRDTLTWNTRQDATLAAERAREVERQTATWAAKAPEPVAEPELLKAEPESEPDHAPAPLLPAWRDPTGQGRDSLGRGLDGASVGAAVARDGAVRREREAAEHSLRATYRDPVAASEALHEVVKRGGWGRAALEVAGDPTRFGELRGKEGWFASAAAKQERMGAEHAAGVLPGNLRRIGEAEESVRQAYMRSVEGQRTRDAVAVPGLSKEAQDVLRDVRMARLMAEVPRDGEGYDASRRRREAAVAAAWRDGRADPRVANELDGFMIAASRRLGEDGERAALHTASSGRRMALPGVGREHRAGLDELAGHFAQAREGMTLSQAWGRRVERETQEAEKEAERVRARQEERARRGLPPEPEQDRERRRQDRGFDLGR